MRPKSLVLKLLPGALHRALADLRARVFDGHAVKSYSQEGEDLLLRRMFDDRKRGFYIDVGAHHPRRFSNTYNFYRRGWNGINIEPNPETIRSFARERKRDANLQLGVADRAQTLVYHVFDDPALNTFDEALVQWRLENTPYRLVGTIDVPVERLDDILYRYLPPGQHIDFLSVDVEGLDLAVLRSNDWYRYRPECVLVEALNTSLEGAMTGEVFMFMKAQGYELFAKTFNTLVFRDRRTRLTSPDSDEASL